MPRPLPLLVLFLQLVAHSACQCTYISCVDYDSGANMCQTIATVNGAYLFQYSSCPSGTYCPSRFSTSITSEQDCASTNSLGATCSDPAECTDGFCVNSTCKSRLARLGEQASANYECGKGLYVSSATGLCVRQVAAGYACSGQEYLVGACRDKLVCNGGYCWQPMSIAAGSAATNKLVCKTLYINSTTGLCAAAPILAGTNAAGIKLCTTDTADSDCVYTINDTVKFTASQLGKSCICTRYSEDVHYYCELGEGDTVYIANVKSVHLVSG